jgi:large subunit ribosomal protein L16
MCMIEYIKYLFIKMKQNPSVLKYKKNHRVSFSFFFLKEQKNFYLKKGVLALQTQEPGKLTYSQIEACRKSIRRNLKKQGTVYLRTFTSFSVTKKAIASRMGKGKGVHAY